MTMKGVSDQEHKNLLVSVGTHRGERRLSPVEVAQLLNKATDAGLTHKDCADELSISPTQVSTFLKLLRLDPSVQHFAQWGSSDSAGVSFSSLAKLARLNADEQEEAAEAIIRHDLTWNEVVQLVQLWDRSPAKGIGDCIDEVLEMRPEVEEQNVVIGAIVSDELQARLDELSQKERDEHLGRVLEESLPHSVSFNGRLGCERFTITIDDGFEAIKDVDQLESAINDALIGDLL